MNVPSVLSQLPISRNCHTFFGFTTSTDCGQSLGFCKAFESSSASKEQEILNYCLFRKNLLLWSSLLNNFP